jgi:hypothetical protein
MVPYTAAMPQAILLNPRDYALLRLLDVTPATAMQIRKASVALVGEPFRDERRVRERMQALVSADLVRSWSGSLPGGGLLSYYRLSPEGHRTVFPDATEGLPKSASQEIAPSRFRHSMATADAIVHALVACHDHGVTVHRVLGDGRLVLEAGEYRQIPDFHLQLAYQDRMFNVVFEIDNGTEPIDSEREQSIRTKIDGYEAYQDWVIWRWKESGDGGLPPRFRVVFLTTGDERAKHILALASKQVRNPQRQLIYASTQEKFLGTPDAVTRPILQDHHGNARAIAHLTFNRNPGASTQPVIPSGPRQAAPAAA